MAKYNGPKFTRAGRELLAAVIAGADSGAGIQFTRVVIGSGELPENAVIDEITELADPKLELPITSVRKTGGQATVTALLSNEGLETGFFAREIGVFATDPSDENMGEILYGYANAGDYPDYIPGYEGSDVVQQYISLITVIDQAENVTAVIDGGLVYVTQQNLNSEVTRIESNINNMFQPEADISGFWTRAEEDGKIFRPAPLDKVRELLGVTGRISLEEAIANLENKVDMIVFILHGTKFIYENFKPAQYIDTYSCNVISAVAGDDSIDCDPVSGVLPGGWYTLTDGAQSEYVQVNNASLENGIQRVILKAPIANTYDLSKCVMRRTTAAIEEGQATSTGADEIITITDDWRTDMFNFHVRVKHNHLSGNPIKVYASFRARPQVAVGEALGTGNGANTIYLFQHQSGIRYDSVRLYYDGARINDGYEVNTEVGHIICAAPAGASITADYEYGWTDETWREMGVANEFYSLDYDETEYLFEVPANMRSNSVCAVRISSEATPQNPVIISQFTAYQRSD